VLPPPHTPVSSRGARSNPIKILQNDAILTHCARAGRQHTPRGSASANKGNQVARARSEYPMRSAQAAGAPRGPYGLTQPLCTVLHASAHAAPVVHAGGQPSLRSRPTVGPPIHAACAPSSARPAQLAMPLAAQRVAASAPMHAGVAPGHRDTHTCEYMLRAHCGSGPGWGRRFEWWFSSPRSLS
jgi:hypothetical protein